MITPFSITPNPLSLYLTDNLRAVIHKARFVLENRQGLTVIYGDLGTGKSTITRYLFAEYDAREDCRALLIPTPNFASPFAFLKSISDDFGIEAARSRQAQERKLQQFLTEQFIEKRNVILFVDEAQNLDSKQLELVRSLLNYETNESKMIQVVLAGQNELADRLRHKKNKALYSRIMTISTLEPLDADDTRQMLEHRCSFAGIETPFSGEAIKAIHERAGGVPRAVLKLCAMLYDLQRNGIVKELTAATVEEWASEVAL